MDRNAVLAIIFSSLFIFIFLYMNQPEKGMVVHEKLEGLAKQEQNLLLKSVPLVKKKIFRKSPILQSSSSNLDQHIIPIFHVDKKTEKNNQIQLFQVKNEIFQIQFTNLNAGIKSLELLRYKLANGQFMNAIFSKNREFTALETSFVQASKIQQPKVDSIYSYGIYRYQHALKNLQIVDSGSLDKQINFYHPMVLRKTKELIDRYRGKDKKLDQDIQIVLFRSEYGVGSKGKVAFFKLFYIFQKSYLINIDFTIERIKGDQIHFRSNDSAQLKKSFYIYWSGSLGPYFDLQNPKSYDTISTAYLSMDEKELTEHVLTDNQDNISNFKSISMDSRYLLLSFINDWAVNERGQKIWKFNGEYTGDIYQGSLIASSGITSLFSSSLEKEDLGNERIGIAFNDFVLNKETPLKELHLALFIGPKTRSLLNEAFYKDFDLFMVRDRSWIPLIKPLEWLMEWILFTCYALTNSFGISIIFLSIIFKVLLNPLTKKSLESTGKMTKVAPKLQAIKDQYKNNPEKQKKALMEFYKKEKLNPLGGCLPLFLQLPILLALSNVISFLLELKDVNFLWIQDLASPDTVLNVDLLFTKQLNLLPLIMAFTFGLQLKLGGQSSAVAMQNTSNSSAKMTQYFIVFIIVFVFWSMPSGLILYWIVQNIMQIGQQLFTNWKKSRAN